MKYAINDFLKLVILAQDKNKYIENIDGSGLPSADTFHPYIKNNGTIQNIHESFRTKVSKVLKNTKQRIVLLFDETYEPYYGRGKSNQYIHGYRPVRGCKGCYKFLCCQALLPDGTKIFTDAIPLHMFYDNAHEVGKILKFVKSTKVKILFCLFNKSKSTNIIVRHFLFLCSFVMYNAWKLQYSSKICFNRFMSALSNQIIEERYYWQGFMYCLMFCYGSNRQLLL